MAETIKYAEQYLENKAFNIRYENAKDQYKYLRKYESKIILFSGAERMLQRKGFPPTPSNISALKSSYQDLLSQKKNLSFMLKSSQSEIKELERMKRNMEEYLSIIPKDLLQHSEQYKSHEL